MLLVSLFVINEGGVYIIIMFATLMGDLYALTVKYNIVLFLYENI